MRCWIRSANNLIGQMQSHRGGPFRSILKPAISIWVGASAVGDFRGWSSQRGSAAGWKLPTILIETALASFRQFRTRGVATRPLGTLECRFGPQASFTALFGALQVV